MKFAKQRDKNEASIVDALRKVGAAVVRLDGAGLPDLLVSYRGAIRLIEVKNPSTKAGKAHSREGMGGKGELTPSQVRWWAEWEAAGGVMPVIARTPQDALESIGAATTGTTGNDDSGAVKQAECST